MSRIGDEIVPDDKDVTQKVLQNFDFSQSMEKDIDGVDDKIDDSPSVDKFDEVMQKRLSLVSSWNSRSNSAVERLQSGDHSFDDAFELIDVPRNEENIVLHVSDAARLNRTLSDAQELIGMLTVMAKIGIQSMNYIQDTLDVQESRQKQTEAVKFLRDNMDKMIESSVPGAVAEGIEEGTKNVELKARVDELEERVDSVDDSSFDADDLKREVLDEIDSDNELDLIEVLQYSDIQSQKDLGKMLKQMTGLKNDQIAGILDTTKNTVSQW